MPVCPSCGNRIPEGKNFCSQCGKSLYPEISPPISHPPEKPGGILSGSDMIIVVAVCILVIVVLPVFFTPQSAGGGETGLPASGNPVTYGTISPYGTATYGTVSPYPTPTPTPTVQAPSGQNAESLVRTYVNHIDNGRYEEALRMIAGTQYSLAQQMLNSQIEMDKMRSGGGSAGEYVEITDLLISGEPASVNTYNGQTISYQKVVWSCKLKVRGKQAMDLITHKDTLTSTWRVNIVGNKATIASDPAIPIIPYITYLTR